MRTITVLLLFMLCLAAVAEPKAPFLRLSETEKRQVIEAARQAVTQWLRKDYDGLYSRMSRVGYFRTASGLSETERKQYFLKWCHVWRERNPYNARLRKDEKPERLRVVDVNVGFLTVFVMLYMHEDYFNSLLKGTWKPTEKLAFVEYYIRGRRYMEALLLETDGWKLLVMPLNLDEQTVAHLETRAQPQKR